MEGPVTGRAVDPAVLRYELLKSHYRSNLNFTRKGLDDSASAVQRLRDFHRQLSQSNPSVPSEADLEDLNRSHPVLKEFTEALADDLNVSAALAAVFAWLRHEHKDAGESLAVLTQIDRVLAVLEATNGFSREMDMTEVSVSAKCQQIDAARAAKDFTQADNIRRELIEAGFEVKTTKEGTVARRKLA